MNFENKYRLTAQQSLFLAKKRWDANVYCGMKMENRAVTFPQTKTILDGVNVPNVRLDDIQAILNMRDAWRFLLDATDRALDLAFVCKINEYVARNEALAWGSLRTGAVYISGTEYVPPVPAPARVQEQLGAILAADVSATEKALDLFAWCARSQLFWDGNKRTGLLAANKLLMDAGAGMLTVKEQDMLRFNDLLVAFYDTGDAAALKSFLYDHAIEGLIIDGNQA